MKTPPLALLLAVLAAACSSGGGGGGKDRGTNPPEPARPGWVVFRLHDTLTVVEADGTGKIDLDTSTGTKSLVGFTDQDEIVYRVAVNSTAGNLYVVGIDGSDKTLVASNVYRVLAWPDASHLIVEKGPGPDLAVNPRRDLYLVPLDGSGELALADETQDEAFGGIFGSTLVFRRGPVTGPADLYAIPALGGSEVQLTSAGPAELFFGFTDSGRVVYTSSGTNSDVFSVKLDGTGLATVSDSPERENAVAIRGERVIVQEAVLVEDPELGNYTVGNVYAANADGTGHTELAVTDDVPEDFQAITEDGRVVVLRQTSFDPPEFELLSVPNEGGAETILATLETSGMDRVVGDTVLFHRGDPSDLIAIGADGEGERTLANLDGEEVVNAIEQERVIFSVTTNDVEKLWSVRLTGGSEIQLRESEDYETFNAALANRVVMTIPGEGGKTDIATVNSAGGELTVVAADPDNEVFRDITPDGRVIFTRNRGQFLDDLLIVKYDGTGEVNLSNRPDEDVYLGFLP